MLLPWVIRGKFENTAGVLAEKLPLDQLAISLALQPLIKTPKYPQNHKIKSRNNDTRLKRKIEMSRTV
jgi:hypothetical protein